MLLRKMLTPKWLAFGLVAVAAFGTCLALGWWQWTRFVDGDGSVRNLGYTALWPVFGVFAIYLWWRLLSDSLRPADADPAEWATGSAEISQARRHTEGGESTSRARGRFPGPRLPRVQFTYDPSERVAERVVDDQSDPELAAYNRYLADLNANARGAR